MPLQSSGSISMSQINSEVASVNSNSLTTLSTNAIAYNNGQGNGTTNSPYQMKEFLGYTHTQTQGISYSKTSRHGTADSQITAKISRHVTYNYMGVILTGFRIRVVWNLSAGTYTISIKKRSTAETGKYYYNNNNTAYTMNTGWYTVGTAQIPSPYGTNNVDQIRLNRTQTAWAGGYVDVFPAAGSYNSVGLTAGATALTPNSFQTASGPSKTYEINHQYSGQKEEGFGTSTYYTFDDYSLTFRRSGYFDYTTSPIFAIETEHKYTRQGFSYCLHPTMLVGILENGEIKYVKVTDVKVGDTIKTYQDFTKVTKVITNHMREGYYELLDGLKITGDHPIKIHEGPNKTDGWTNVEDLDLPKMYIQSTTPTVYIETESEDFITYWPRTSNPDNLDGITVHGKYADIGD